MSALRRREFVIAGAALAATAIGGFARAAPGRCQLGGAIKQGGLVVGTADGAARVTVDGERVNLSSEGVFAFGFAYDQKVPAHLAIAYIDGGTQTDDVPPEVRQYEVQTITGLPPNLVTPSPDDVARIQREHALVAEVRKTDSDFTWFSQPFDWPAHGIVSSLFGSQRVLNGVASVPHFGVDIAAGEGAIVRAPAKGKVLIAQEFLLEGNYTMLDHGHGVFSGYMHQSRVRVRPGDVVDRGEEIGRVGKTGRATGPHLHWSLNWFQVRLDPSLSARSPLPTRD